MYLMLLWPVTKVTVVFFLIIIYLLLPTLGLRGCAQVLSRGEWGLLSSCGAARFAGLLWSMGLRSCGLQAPRSRLLGSGVVHTGLVALRHRGSSSIRDPSRGPCIGGWIFNHCPTRRVPKCISYHCVKWFSTECLREKSRWPALMSVHSIRLLNSHSCKNFWGIPSWHHFAFKLNRI